MKITFFISLHHACYKFCDKATTQYSLVTVCPSLNLRFRLRSYFAHAYSIFSKSAFLPLVQVRKDASQIIARFQDDVGVVKIFSHANPRQHSWFRRKSFLLWSLVKEQGVRVCDLIIHKHVNKIWTPSSTRGWSVHGPLGAIWSGRPQPDLSPIKDVSSFLTIKW